MVNNFIINAIFNKIYYSNWIIPIDFHRSKIKDSIHTSILSDSIIDMSVEKAPYSRSFKSILWNNRPKDIW